MKTEYYEEGKAPDKSSDVQIAIRLKEENAAFKVEKYVHPIPTAGEQTNPFFTTHSTHGLSKSQK